MKRSLAKLLLGTDVHEDYSVAEHENLASKSRIEKLTQDFEPLKAQKEKIARDTEIANTKLSSLQQQLQSIEDRIRQRIVNSHGIDIKAELQKILDQKDSDFTAVDDNLDKVRKQQEQLEDEELKTKRQKQSLEDDIKTLNQTITELKKQVEKRDDKRQQATNKLPQRREIKNRLTTLKNEWNEKLTTFQERTNSTDKATLLALQTELEGYYRIINNAINTPSE